MMKKFTAVILIAVFISVPAVISVHGDDGCIHISSAEELLNAAALFTLDKASENVTVSLDADIDISGRNFTGIPIFSGTFLGNGHKITGFETDGQVLLSGFFRVLGVGASVSELHVVGSVGKTGETVCSGGIAGENNGVITGCTFTGEAKGEERTGGICGVNNVSGVIENCISYCSVSALHRSGGICGENAGLIYDCVNEGDVNTEALSVQPSGLPELSDNAEELIDLTDIGGIAGYSSGIIRGCVNGGTVGHLRIGYNVGGIAGRLGGYIESCENKADVYGRKDVGGIAGQTDPYTQWDIDKSNLAIIVDLSGRINDDIEQIKQVAASAAFSAAFDIISLTAAANSLSAAVKGIQNETAEFAEENLQIIKATADFAIETVKKAQPALRDINDAVNSVKKAVDTAAEMTSSLRDAYDTSSKHVSAALEALDGCRAELVTAHGMIVDCCELIAEFVKSADIERLPEVTEQLRGSLTLLMSTLAAASGHMVDAADELSFADELAAPASNIISAAKSIAGDIDAAALAAVSALETVYRAVDALSRYNAASFRPLDIEADRKKLFDSLGSISRSVSSITEKISDADMAPRIVSLVSDTSALVTTVTGALGGIRIGMSEDMVSDISENVKRGENGSIYGCTNTGRVNAQNNAGGIVGAVTIDVKFDPEDEYNISAFLSGGAKYLIYASVSSCVNKGGVTAEKNCAGGIAGRMDHGAVRDCVSENTVTAGEKYSGGIAGYSAGYINRCRSNTVTSGGAYVGGIAGIAFDVKDCLCLPHITGEGGCRGAVAGDVTGSSENNFYSECETGAINGISYSGSAEYVEYEKLVEMSGNDDVFRYVTVTFFGEKTTESISIGYAETVNTYPDVPDKDGKKWVWDKPDGAIYTSVGITGSYVSVVKTLSSGGDLPKILVEGTFDEETELTVKAFTPGGIRENTVLCAGTVSVDNGTQLLRVHAYGKKNGILYVYENGEPIVTSYKRDGSYIVFDMKNGSTFVYVKQGFVWYYAAIPAALIAVAALCVVFAVIRRRKKAA